MPKPFAIAGTARRVVRSLAALAALALLAAAPARADYPDRPVTIVVPFAPGGPTDLVGRVLASALSQKLGQSVVVENKAGAGGNIGISAVARAKPDGYTLLVSSSAFVVNPGLYAKAPYDPFKDFAPIAFLGTQPNVLVVDPRLGIDTLQQLIERARTQPDFFNYASPGSGTTPQLAAELIKLRTGITLTHVPYNGAGPATQAVVGGTTQLALTSLSSLLPHIKSGALKALVQTGAERWIDIPDVPTMAEAGIPNAVSETFQILLAPVGTPRPILDRLTQEALAAMARGDVRERLLAAGFGPTAKGPDYLRRRIAEEVPMWRSVIEQAGIKVE
jgi:tripartite-type tricarboxylate transporter receptor subunit TctC